MAFAKVTGLLILEIAVAFVLVVGALSLVAYILVRVIHKAKRDAEKSE